MRSMSLLLVAAALAACSTAPQPRTAKAEAHLDKMLAGKVAQKPVDCLPTHRSGDMVVIDDNTILFRQSSSKVFRNDLNGGACSGLGSGSYALVTKQYGGMGLCRGDIAQVMDLSTGMTVGSCILGDFVPYTTPRG